MNAKRLWTRLTTAVWLGLTRSFSAVAAPAVLDGDEPGSRVNIRSAPTTQSSSPHYGVVGDKVETLREVAGTDGYTCYYIRFNRSGAEGWVRGDLIRFTGNSGASRRIAEGTYWVGATGLGLGVQGGQYQVYDEGENSAWKPISELRYIRAGVIRASKTFWCLSMLPQPRNTRSMVCTANGWGQ